MNSKNSFRQAGFAFCILFCATFFSCSKENASDVNQSKIYSDYEVFYDSNSDKTWVVARFRFGGATGTILELDSTAYVKFNADTLPYNVVFQAHFKEYAGRVTTGTFTYRNLNNDVYVNTLPAYDTIAFADDFDTIRKSVANTIAWAGSPLAANDNVGIFIGGWQWGQAALKLQTGAGATSMVLGTNETSSLQPGPATCYMDRATDVAITQGTPEGGRIRGKYRARTKVVQVVP